MENTPIKEKKQDYCGYLHKVIHNQGREQRFYCETKQDKPCLVDNFLNSIKKFRQFFGDFFDKAE